MAMLDALKPYYPEQEIASLKEALTKPSVHALYLNVKKLSDKDFLTLFPLCRPHPFLPHAYYYDPEAYDLGKSLYHNLGCFYIMDPASMVVPYFLKPEKGERILDLCAAPGGKTTVLSLLLEGTGSILSNDISYPRSKETSSNVERLGLRNVAVTSGDFESCYQKYQGYFDAILLDAPCSGSAMFRKDPRLEEDWSMEKVLRCQAIQKRLLHLASTMVVPGGRIMYSTCSFSYEEDEAVILDFLASHQGFHAVSLPDQPSFYHHPDLLEAIHLFPSFYEGEGQFLCLLVREGGKTHHPSEKTHAIPKKFLPLLHQYGLDEADVFLHQGYCYVMPEPLFTEGLSLLRYGVRVCEDKDILIPDHALASSCNGAAIELPKEKALAYLRGETFPLSAEDGFRVVAYQGIPLGFVKMVRGVAKNHYPKGLRRCY